MNVSVQGPEPCGHHRRAEERQGAAEAQKGLSEKALGDRPNARSSHTRAGQEAGGTWETPLLAFPRVRTSGARGQRVRPAWRGYAALRLRRSTPDPPRGSAERLPSLPQPQQSQNKHSGAGLEPRFLQACLPAPGPPSHRHLPGGNSCALGVWDPRKQP